MTSLCLCLLPSEFINQTCTAGIILALADEDDLPTIGRVRSVALEVRGL